MQKERMRMMMRMTDSILYQVQCALIAAQHCTAQHIAKQSRTASASSESVNL